MYADITHVCIYILAREMTQYRICDDFLARVFKEYYCLDTTPVPWTSRQIHQQSSLYKAAGNIKGFGFIIFYISPNVAKFCSNQPK
jgi:hypothetical protein